MKIETPARMDPPRKTWKVTLAARRRIWGAYVNRAEAERVAAALRKHGMDATVESPDSDEPRAA